MSSLSTPVHSTVYLKDYTPLPFSLPQIHLTFHLDPKKTRVKGVMHFEHKEGKEGQALTLQGEKLQLLSVKLEGKQLSPDLYKQSPDQLEIFSVPQHFVLEIEVEICPEANKELDGLYASQDILCTQNEPEGFRRIMYFFDRPDNMSVFTTTLIAKKASYPQLLSNGNQVQTRELEDGYHQVTWEDPFPKPCYLFALVAGNLGKIEDHFITRSGRKILLEIYSDKGNEYRLQHAMQALKNSMKWDEERFGLEYDLDIYMIVAVDSFNMGAMENKGLNIFNSSCTLAHSQSATDDDFLRVEGVIAHEYFHNWTGNRVTCRDWFQLTLKEGLTVFRDQEFSSDMNTRAVVRIEEVNKLKTFQFPEDAGPTSHPIKPSSYQQINNFYTSTVYDKGSEVIRMIHTLIGEKNFQKGIEKYFEWYDGQAVTTEDFIHAMQEASGFDFSQFTRWYHQKGTPVVEVEQSYENNTYTLTLKQLPTEKQAPALLIPLKVALFSQEGKLQNEESLLLLDDWEKSFSFSSPSFPLLSINRNFTAPIHLKSPLKVGDSLKLLSCENDPYNLWECSQHLATHWVETNLSAKKNLASPEYYQGLKSILEHSSFEPAFKALALTLPSLSLLTDLQSPPLYEESHQALKQLKEGIAKQLEKVFLAHYQNLSLQNDNTPSPKAMGIRKLKNTCLQYLCALDSYHPLAFEQFKHAQNMTCELSALRALVHHQAPQAQEALDRFYHKWHKETLVIQKYFATQASNPSYDTLSRVKKLLQDPAFDLQVPNIMRSVVGSFANNPLCFNAPDASGYAFVGEMIQKVDAFNPQMGSLLAKAFKRFKKLDPVRKNAMEQVLNDLVKTPGLSKNSFEIIHSCLTA